MLPREEFFILVRELLDGVLAGELGFVFQEPGYQRELTTTVRQSLAFDFPGAADPTFRVLLGLNSRLVAAYLPADETGAYFIQFLTKGGVADFPRHWPCHNRETAVRSLTRIGGLIETAVMPWLDRHHTFSDFADVLADRHSYAKAKLYMEDGNRAAARRCLELHRTRLLELAEIEEVADELEAIRLMLLRLSPHAANT
jgi:hypothetical protein